MQKRALCSLTLAAKKLFGGEGGLAAIWVRHWKLPFSPLSFGKSFMKIRSAVPENPPSGGGGCVNHS